MTALLRLLALAGGLASPAAVAAPLSLPDAIAAARAQSLEAQRAALAADVARTDRALVDLADDLRATLTGTLGTRWQGRTDRSPPTFRALTREQAYGAQLGYTLYDFGRQSAREAAADLTLQAQELAKDEVDERLFWAVTRAYLGVAAAERLVAVSREQLAVSEQKLVEQRRNYRGGLRPESDVVTAEVDVGRARIVLRNAQSAADQARLRLAQLSSPRDPAALQSRDVPLDGAATRGPAAWTELQQALGAAQPTALAKRLEADRRALEAERRVIAASQSPVLGAQVTAQYANDGPELTPLRPVASGQLQLSWEIPWNGRARLETERITLREQTVDLQLQAEREARDASARLALQDLENAKEHYGFLSRQSELARRQQQLVRSRYLAGQASALEMSTAETAFLSVRLEQVRLGNDVASALVALAEARGIRDPALLSRL